MRILLMLRKTGGQRLVLGLLRDKRQTCRIAHLGTG